MAQFPGEGELDNDILSFELSGVPDSNHGKLRLGLAEKNHPTLQLASDQLHPPKPARRPRVQKPEPQTKRGTHHEQEARSGEDPQVSSNTEQDLGRAVKKKLKKNETLLQADQGVLTVNKAVSDASPRHAYSRSISASALGLTDGEISILREGQRMLACQGSSSPRAASRASSQGLLILDARSLKLLNHHFNSIMAAIQFRVDVLSMHCCVSTMKTYDKSLDLVQTADSEISRFHGIMTKKNTKKEEHKRLRSLRDTTRSLRARVGSLEHE